MHKHISEIIEHVKTDTSSVWARCFKTFSENNPQHTEEEIIKQMFPKCVYVHLFKFYEKDGTVKDGVNGAYARLISARGFGTFFEVDLAFITPVDDMYSFVTGLKVCNTDTKNTEAENELHFFEASNAEKIQEILTESHGNVYFINPADRVP